jgi:hypothetical protein
MTLLITIGIIIAAVFIFFCGVAFTSWYEGRNEDEPTHTVALTKLLHIANIAALLLENGHDAFEGESKYSEVPRALREAMKPFQRDPRTGD